MRAHKPHEGQQPDRIGLIALVNRRRGKANLLAEKPLRGSIERYYTNHAKSGSGRSVKTGSGPGGRNPWRGQTQGSNESCAVSTADDRRTLRGSKAQKPKRMRLTAIGSSACTFVNGRWATDRDQPIG